MLFTSPVFLFVFLPTVILIYYLLPKKHKTIRNIFLLLASLVFYGYGEPKFILVFLISIFVNYLYGILVDRYRTNKKVAIGLLFTNIAFNLAIIFYYKYLVFTVKSISRLTGSTLTVPDILLPIGISFFTFQAISYVVDVYRGKGEVQKNPLNVGLYIAFFPQLIAGPIVRYETVADQINNRKESFELFSEGVTRFIIGFAKKVILANNFAVISDNSFNLNRTADIPIDLAWIGAIAYTLQVYFDFSGYSDMAIGLGKMFGFRFLENFNYPYISKSVSEFWRRWHISLGTWFRDYVYIPLGGSRSENKYQVYINLFIVWFLLGLWHGANYTFIAWGMVHFAAISFERLVGFNKLKTYIFGHVYTMLIVILSRVLYKNDNIALSVKYLKSMFNIFNTNNFEFLRYNATENLYLFIAGIVFSLPVYRLLENRYGNNKVYQGISAMTLIGVFVLSVGYLLKGNYDPFIYFNF